MTKYRTATYIGLTPMTFLWGVTQVTDYLTRMHTAHLANVSKSVTKNATFPRTGGLPCLITHSCMSATSPTVVGGLIFCISATPHPGSLFPLFHDLLLCRLLLMQIAKVGRFLKNSGNLLHDRHKNFENRFRNS